MNINRAPKWDQHRPQFLKLSMAMSIALAFMAFNYTSYHDPTPIILDSEPMDLTEIEVTPPIMREKRPLPPPPTPKVEVVDIIEPEVEPEFIEEKLPEVVEPEVHPTTTVTDAADVHPSPTSPPVLPPPVVEDTEEKIWARAERMPAYHSCTDLHTEAERTTCTQSALLHHIYDLLRYPSIARENGIEGTVVVGFVIDKHGQLTNLEILKDIGGGCGREVLRVISKLGDFSPGQQGGRSVSVLYRVPVKFDLQE